MTEPHPDEAVLDAAIYAAETYIYDALGLPPAMHLHTVPTPDNTADECRS